ncbi:MAG: 4Fe-4S binding protein [Oligoflexia bacterium]|nr:4Fe-4S binding protein [Oligoflexia bacterium]
MNNLHSVNNCNGCALCILKCPNNAISINVRKKCLVIDRFRCINCFLCRDICPVGAIDFVPVRGNRKRYVEFPCKINIKRLKMFFNDQDIQIRT